MLDPKYIREHIEEVRMNCKHRNVRIDIDTYIELDKKHLSMIHIVESIRAERNAVAAKMQNANAAERSVFIAQGKELKESLALKEHELVACEAEWKKVLLQFPNLTHPSAPEGKTDDENAEIRIVGEIKNISHPLDHIALCQKHDLIDFERATKVTGSKFYFLKGKLARLEQALISYTLDLLEPEGYIAMTTPDLAKDDILVGTGFQPRGPETQIYSIENSDISLIGTSEITIGGYHKDEIFSHAVLPIKYAGISHCYRTEAGSYGRESYGLYRVHQFSKVEMFIVCTPEQSEAMHVELLRMEERVFQQLEIPYRVVDICSGDLGGPAYRKYDLEAWMWGRNMGKGGWGEITSTSNCTDFQARRLNIRVKGDDGVSHFAHTLNGTAISLARALIAILENHQQEDGSILIPKVLVPYCGFKKIG